MSRSSCELRDGDPAEVALDRDRELGEVAGAHV
jgi:hypothetical protein